MEIERQENQRYFSSFFTSLRTLFRLLHSLDISTHKLRFISFLLVSILLQSNSLIAMSVSFLIGVEGEHEELLHDESLDRLLRVFPHSLWRVSPHQRIAQLAVHSTQHSIQSVYLLVLQFATCFTSIHPHPTNQCFQMFEILEELLKMWIFALQVDAHQQFDDALFNQMRFSAIHSISFYSSFPFAHLLTRSMSFSM